MPLDPALAALLAALPPAPAASEPAVPDVAQARLDYERNARLMTAPEQRDPVAHVDDTTVPGPAGPVPLRVYRPVGVTAPAPVLLWLHGGGWTIGNVDTADTLARALCAGADAVVVSVGYRLAPEHVWPAGLNDASAALRWVAEHAGEVGGDPARLAVGGDSAGGNLAAVLAQEAAGAGPALVGQVLLYPATELDLERAASHPSWTLHGSGYGLTADAVRWCVQSYLPAGADSHDPHISPAHCRVLTGLPPAVIAVAEFDPLRDQGRAYAASLQEAGVPAVLHEGAGLVHGCFDMLGIVTAARRELDHLLVSVRRLLHGQPGRQPDGPSDDAGNAARPAGLGAATC